MAHVRTYQLGQSIAISQKILNELGAAKACLLNHQSHRELKLLEGGRIIEHALRPLALPRFPLPLALP
jgi:hypothetical protein